MTDEKNPAVTERPLEERYVHEILAKLREDYAKAAQPYFDRLAMIHSLRPMPPLIVTVEQARELGLTPNAETGVL